MALDGTGRAVATFVTGFNAHGQLCEEHSENIRSFQQLLHFLAQKPEDGKVFYAGWSSTLLRGANATNLLSRGHGRIENSEGIDLERLRCAVGDHDGLKACLDHEGHLFVAERSSADNTQLLRSQSTESSPLISQLAIAQNGRIAVTFKQAPKGRLCHIIEFPCFDSFRKWFQDPSGEFNHPEQHHMLQGRPKQLLGNTATFMLLMEDGTVYTWGDARHESLGRPITGGDNPPAEKPGVVDALGGLNITKIASGGWISAALSSEDGALYVWGKTLAGATPISALQQTGSGSITLVDLPSSECEPLDVLDMAVGDGHIAVITEAHRLFVVGDNSCGQLGLGGGVNFYKDWQEVPKPQAGQSSAIEGVAAGPKSTFVYMTWHVDSAD